MGAMRECDKVYSDINKLRAQAKAKKLTLETVALRCGLSKSYMSNAATYGWMPKYVAEGIEDKCKIKKESFIVGDCDEAKESRTPSNMVPVDKDKLYDEIKRRGMTVREVNRRAGYSDGYTSSYLNIHKAIPKPFAIYLEVEYGIEPKTYAPNGTQTGKVEETGESIDYKTMENATYRATYSAIMNTWSFIREDLKAIIKEALSE